MLFRVTDRQKLTFIETDDFHDKKSINNILIVHTQTGIGDLNSELSCHSSSNNQPNMQLQALQE